MSTKPENGSNSSGELQSRDIARTLICFFLTHSIHTQTELDGMITGQEAGSKFAAQLQTTDWIAVSQAAWCVVSTELETTNIRPLDTTTEEVEAFNTALRMLPFCSIGIEEVFQVVERVITQLDGAHQTDDQVKSLDVQLESILAEQNF